MEEVGTAAFMEVSLGTIMVLAGEKVTPLPDTTIADSIPGLAASATMDGIPVIPVGGWDATWIPSRTHVTD
ncbi:hypothetical protein ASC90_20765 [Rhizobium sp. Root1220]|nr:hypothetical protein ASC90_20765 [Rhizobium sp. Root1220]